MGRSLPLTFCLVLFALGWAGAPWNVGRETETQKGSVGPWCVPLEVVAVLMSGPVVCLSARQRPPMVVGVREGPQGGPSVCLSVCPSETSVVDGLREGLRALDLIFLIYVLAQSQHVVSRT